MRRAVLAALIGLAFIGGAGASVLLMREPEPVLAKVRALPASLPKETLAKCGEECVVTLEGSNLGVMSVTVVLRLDDAQSIDYASRINDEFLIAPGPFRIERRLAGLKTTNGRTIDRAHLREALLFQAGGEPSIVIRSLEVGAAVQSGEAPTAFEASGPPTAGPGTAEPALGERRLAVGGLPLELPGSQLASCGTCEIVIEGKINGSSPATLLLRIDDVHSRNYASRLNDERVLPPGPFVWRKSLKGLRTTDKRDIDPRQITRFILADAGAHASVEVASLTLRPIASLPQKALGLSLGTPDAPLPAGFERVSIGDPRLGGQPYAVRRLAPDPLTAGGLRGVARLSVPWPAGRVRISLWTEEPGDWENLPHPLDRRILVNGTEVLKQTLTPPQWIRTRYLAGSEVEPSAHPDPWLSFGARAGGLVSAEIDVADRGIVIEQTGDSPQATFLSAVLIEPAGQRAALDRVLAERAVWYREHFPVGSPRMRHTSHEAGLTVGSSVAEPLRLTVAPDTGVHAIVTVTSAAPIEQPQVTLTAPQGAGGVLKAEVFAAQRQLERVFANSNLLVVKDDRLRADTARFGIRPDEPRRYDLWIEAPAGAKAGRYAGALSVGPKDSETVLPVEVEVLAVELPKPEKPVGYFHEEAPHLSWFPWPGDLRRRQIGCDLATLTRFGLTGNAPALSPLTAGMNEEILRDARIAIEAGTTQPIMAYSPARRAIAEQGIAVAAQSIADAQRSFEERGVMAPIWSIVDEPSNPDLAASDFSGLIAEMKRSDPGIRFSAYLNNPKDRALMPRLDYAVINQGYGIDLSDIAAVKSAGVKPWIYNTDAPRFTAGLWLWHSGAERFLLWHARSPTGDPFDPTDGREGDVQIFYPSMQICPAQPDMNAQIFDMAEGVIDQRWLTWLDRRPEPQAKALAAAIHAELGSTFTIATQYDDRRMEAVRARIVALARSLN